VVLKVDIIIPVRRISVAVVASGHGTMGLDNGLYLVGKTDGLNIVAGVFKYWVSQIVIGARPNQQKPRYEPECF
jgi:hypothetical protein